VLGTAVATGLFRLAPAVALAVVWLIAVLQVTVGVPVALVQVAVLLVAYGTSRYGSTATVWLSGLSIPLGALVALPSMSLLPYDAVVIQLERGLTGPGMDLGYLTVLAAAFVVVVFLLAVPWTVGLVLRLRGRARQDEQQRVVAEEGRSQAEEIARLREDQTRLARDVHDVVGHSLAVILAQAESAQFRPDSDTAAVRTTLANIADSARQSLRDVRQVLSSTTTTTGSATPVGPGSVGSLDALLEGVQTAGNDVRSSVVGSPRPLPPELDVVAFRVLQEMLTNALKHGRRGEPVLVERHWDGELRLEVRNAVGDGPVASRTGPGRESGSDEWRDETAPLHLTDDQDQHHARDDDPSEDQQPDPGRGLEGMRRRLESVGGRLDVRRRVEPGVGATFTATAWVPFRSERA
jgi:signal transduction histidine kinase